MAKPRQAAEQYALAAQLDPLEFMTHALRCLSLQDLAEFVAAGESCARARELNTTSLYGPLATSYLEFGRGDYGEALRWLDRALELAPLDLDLIDYRVWILAELGLFEEAQRTLERLPAASAKRDYLAAFLAVARQDPPAIGPAIAAFARHSGQFDMAQWLGLANLQLLAGDPAAASAALGRARQMPDWQPATLTTPDHVRLGNSAATSVAAIELATGNLQGALQVLDALEEMLDRFEQGGGACAGLYSLRAESRAMRGDSEGAMLWLRRAHEKGWRAARAARRDPYLQSLRDLPGYRQLLAETERQLAATAGTFTASRQ
jgi:tetratricopeptide (TPR) repeat protein